MRIFIPLNQKLIEKIDENFINKILFFEYALIEYLNKNGIDTDDVIL